jgi:hypothetical protein
MDQARVPDYQVAGSSDNFVRLISLTFESRDLLGAEPVEIFPFPLCLIGVLLKELLDGVVGSRVHC